MEILVWAPIAVLALSAGFLGLFVYDVHQTRSAKDAPPARMLSELAFNAFMNACCLLAVGVALLQFARWILPLLTSDLRTVVLTALVIAVTLVALRTCLMREKSLPTFEIPDFMRCDGEFVAAAGSTNPLDEWCGWIRFEGHGTCRIQRSAESDAYLTCEWHTHAGGTLRIVLPAEGRPAGAPAELFARGTDADPTDASLEGEVVDVCLAADGPPACRLTFEPEEG